jgi:hypothetical protein
MYLQTRTLSRGHELVLPEACFFVPLSIGCASIPVSDLETEAIWLRYLRNVVLSEGLGLSMVLLLGGAD